MEVGKMILFCVGGMLFVLGLASINASLGVAGFGAWLAALGIAARG